MSNTIKLPYIFQWISSILNFLCKPIRLIINIILFVPSLLYHGGNILLKKCIEWPNKSKMKPSGLKNFSAECYMNSIIQALAASNKLIEQLSKLKRIQQTSDINLDCQNISTFAGELRQYLIKLVFSLLKVVPKIFRFVKNLLPFYRKNAILNESRQDLSKEETRGFKAVSKKFCGLKNLLADWFNSIIQVLGPIAIFFQQLLKLKRIQQTLDTNLDCLVDLLNSLNNPDVSSDSNSHKLVSLIRKIGWQKESQQDCYELLSVLINSIQKEIKRSPKSEQFSMPLKIKIVYKFNGINIKNRIQDHLGLSIGLCGNYSDSSGVTLKYLIDEHFAPAIIDDDSSKTSQMYFYKDTPEILLLHIQANKWDNEKGEMIKPKYFIKYEHHLSLDLNVADDLNYENERNVKYELCAVVHHMGTISGGHYIAFRKWKQKWYLVNDEQVTEHNFNCDVCPYILIYEKLRS